MCSALCLSSGNYTFLNDTTLGICLKYEYKHVVWKVSSMLVPK